jgi:hypothetical protein
MMKDSAMQVRVDAWLHGAEQSYSMQLTRALLNSVVTCWQICLYSPSHYALLQKLGRACSCLFCQ